MRILVVDDHKLFADGLSLVLHSLSDNIELVSANNSLTALDHIQSNPNFDLLLLDMQMPGLDGLALLKSLRERNVLIPSVVISATENIDSIKQALDLGAFGFVPKSYSSKELLHALEQILQGDSYVPTEIKRKINQLKLKRNNNNYEQDDLLQRFGITTRQHEVLKLMTKGYSNNEIAETMFLSQHTIKSHVGALFSALQATNRTSCVRIAQDNGLIE